MFIKKTRIRNLNKYLGGIPRGAELNIAVPVNSDIQNILISLGFSDKLNIGDTILPSAIFGNISLFNAEGKYKIRKDLPMETAYRQVEWHWEQWCGYDETEEKSKIVDVPYERYPREFIDPPGVELSIGSMDSSDLIVISPTIEFVDSNESLLLHTINLFLEIFGSAHIFTKGLNKINVPVTNRLNWTILPKGEYPWEKIKQLVKPILEKAKEGNRPVLLNRYNVISSFNPDFVAIGKAGFSGYLIFGFTLRNIYICESAYYGNATYIFESNWEELSRMTKAEILNQDLQKDRIIHREGWDRKIASYLK